MSRNPDPFPVDLENWNDNLFKRAHKQRFLDMLIQFDAVFDALKKEEISDFAAVMQMLEFFDNARLDRTFSERGWRDYLARFPEGTVEIPALWLKVLMQVWSLYTEADSPVAFEKAAGMSGEGNRRKANTKIIELTEKYNIARMVAQQKFDALGRGEELSDEAAILETYEDLAEFPKAKRSRATIANAWERWGEFFEFHAAIMSAKLPDRLP